MTVPGRIIERVQKIGATVVTIDETTVIEAPVERCFDLARSVEVHLEGNIHWGESALAAAGVTSGLLGLGQQVTWRARHFGVWHRLTSRVTKFERPDFFQDRMISGIFRFMEHDHFFTANGRRTIMRDVFRFAAPLPLLGRIAESAFLAGYMRRLLTERNAVIKRIAESGEWRQYLP